jgi:hypothetical protein
MPRAIGIGIGVAFANRAAGGGGSPPAPPNAPTGFAAAAASASEIDLSWSAPAGGTQTGYLIQRAPDAAGSPGAWATLTLAGAAALSYADAGLPVGATFWYRVQAYNGGGYSAFTSAASATTQGGSYTPSLDFSDARNSQYALLNFAW